MDDLVDRIYEAAVLPDLWPGVLRDLTRVADAREAVLLVGNGDTYRWIGSSPFVEDITARHYTYAGARERTRRLLAVDSPGFVHDSD